MDSLLIAGRISSLGLDDSFAPRLSAALRLAPNPAEALSRLRWTIPPHQELQAMSPEERLCALVPIISVIISKFSKKLRISYDFQDELVAEGFATLAGLDFTFARDVKNYAWKALYRNISTRLDSLQSPCDSDLLDQVSPFTNWAGIFPALRALYDCCEDDLDRAIIKARWADGRCITDGYFTPVKAIADQTKLSESEVVERIYRLENRWRCYVNRTCRFTKHFLAIPFRPMCP